MTGKPDLARFEEELSFSNGGNWWRGKTNDLPGAAAARQRFPREVVLVDETLREGEETAGVYLDDDDRMRVVDALRDAGVRVIQTGYPGAIDEHYRFTRKLRSQNVGIRLVSHTRTYTREGEWKDEIYRAVEAGSDELCLVGSCSRTLTASTPWLPREAVPDRVSACVEYACGLGVSVSVALVDMCRTPLEWIERTYRNAVAAGASCLYVMDGQGGLLPETVAVLVSWIREAFGDKVRVAMHCHNDFGLAMANTLAGLREGASVVDVVVNGLGDKAGITALEELACILEVLYGVATGLRLEQLYSLSKVVEETFGVRLAVNKPVVGQNIVRHEIDSHIAAILRGLWWSWETFQPGFFGRERELRWGLGKLRRGRSGALAAKLEAMGVQATDEQWDRIVHELDRRIAASSYLIEAEVEAVIASVIRGIA